MTRRSKRVRELRSQVDATEQHDIETALGRVRHTGQQAMLLEAKLLLEQGNRRPFARIERAL